jgi:hypothetical protein
MYITALFTIAKLWKPPRCPTPDEWIKKMWYVYSMDYYSGTKNEIMLFAGKLRELENIMSSKVSQAQKVKGRMFSFICGSWAYKINARKSTYMILYTNTYI